MPVSLALSVLAALGASAPAGGKLAPLLGAARAAADDPARQRLEAVVRANPGLKAAADLQREVMAHGARHAPRVAPLAQDAAEVEARLGAGVPLLHERPWALDLRRVRLPEG